ncbi:MAG: hypothetical protein DHS20C18_06240 [Saprospiraceae bacterium]|nr:MAG: hypothetical protein DHS20C18_06240 [Saprospiraceae bacterium]
MKDKNLAGILALFFGVFGVHRFYLGQIGLGIFYIFFFWIMWLVGLIDAIAFFSMDTDEFNRKYNKEYLRDHRDTDFDRHDYRQRERAEPRNRKNATQRERRPVAPIREKKRPRGNRPNPFKQSGILKYKDFEYQGAIDDFKKAIEIDPKDIALHFNLACAYSLMEKSEQAFSHLDKAVEYGFNDFKRIKEHDALAYLRIQPAFEEFEKNGFQLVHRIEPPKEDILSSSPSDLLEQLKRLGDLREKGLLTEEEFATQKKRLLDNS